MNRAALNLLLGLLAEGAFADTILVSTTADTISPDGACSLREAIIASNLNRSGDVTAADCFGTGVDDIFLGRGAGTVINLASNLPVITEQVHIAGPTARLVIIGTGFHIPPSGVGLAIASTAPFTTLRNLVIQNCDTGIQVHGAGSIITSSYIGTDATGTSGVSNGAGIEIQASDVRIGGTTGVTPGGACTGECNLIAGNPTGVVVTSASGTLIRGNQFGTNAAGTAAIGGNTGIRFTGTSQGFTIGGTLPGAGNLVSGYVTGISLSLTPVPFAANSAIEGNYIGTNAAGSAALPNQNGIIVGTSDAVFPLTIGGPLTTATNLISGNSNGILVSHANNVVIQGNRIGTDATGSAAVPNSSGCSPSPRSATSSGARYPARPTSSPGTAQACAWP
jgi:CSLREA domain-containing protein